MPEFARGTWSVLDTDPVIVAVRCELLGNVAVAVHNLLFECVEVRRDPLVDGEPQPALNCLLSHARCAPDEKGYCEFTIELYGYFWLRPGGLDDFLGREMV